MNNHIIGPDSAWCERRPTKMAHEMVATPVRDYPDFPCSMQDESGNTYSCPNASTFESWEQSGMTVVKPKKAASKKGKK